VLTHLKRTTFSDIELDLMLWLMRMNGVVHVPTINQVKGVWDAMHAGARVKPQQHVGGLGHTYYLLNIGSIIADVSGLVPVFYVGST
jgi:hypothetical protein